MIVFPNVFLFTVAAASLFLDHLFCLFVFVFFGFEMDTDESGWAPVWRAGVGVFVQWIRDRITARGMEVGLKPCVW